MGVTPFAGRGKPFRTGAELPLKLLLDAGADPIGMENGGSSLIQHILQGMDMGLGFDESRHGLWEDIFAGRKKGKIGMIHMLAKRGA